MSDGPASEEQQGCQEELVLRLVPGREGGQGGGRDARCHSLPARARTASGTFQGHAAGERYHPEIRFAACAAENIARKRINCHRGSEERHGHLFFYLALFLLPLACSCPSAASESSVRGSNIKITNL